MQETVVSPRVPLQLEINYKTNYARADLKAVLKNISLTGGFLALNTENLRTKDKISVSVTVADRERTIKAEIIWKNSEGVGVKFIPKNNRDIQIIDDLIYFVESKQIGYKSIFLDFLNRNS